MNHKNEKTQWSRICPKCGGTVYHKSRQDRNRREREGRTCGGKANEDCKVISKAQRKKLSEALMGTTYPNRRARPDKTTPPKWTRPCPNCDTTIGYHGEYHHYQRAVKQNTLCNACAIIECEGTLADKMRKNPKFVKQMRATKAGFKDWAEYQKKYPKWKKYKAAVWSETYKSLNRNPILENFELRGRCGVEGAYQIDHIVSVKEGFKRRLSPKTIGAYSNLRMIPWKENRTKG